MNAQMIPVMSTPSSASTAASTAATNLSLDSLKQRLRRLNLYGLLAHAEQILAEPWLERVLQLEESERQQRSLKRRLGNARLGSFKPLADFDYGWPEELDRTLLDELFTFSFLDQAANIVIVGPNGLGKTMLAKNLLQQAILRGHSARFTAASDMLHDLAAQDSSTQLARRLRRYITPAVLCVDEVGYLSYDTRYADLLFEVITRRYQLHRCVILTTNKAFGEWNQVFPNATCVVALVDRLVHRSEILTLAGDSYRLKEAQERAAQRASRRAAAKKTRRGSSTDATQ
jgi:DNA replication protein DnaC